MQLIELLIKILNFDFQRLNLYPTFEIQTLMNTSIYEFI